MNKSIPLTPKATTWIFLINGCLNIYLGLDHLISFLQIWQLFLGILVLSAGALMAIYSILLFANAGFIPKIQFNDRGLSIREGIFKQQKNITWKDVEEITFRSFQIDFHLRQSQIESIMLHTNAVTSLEVKSAIRQHAESIQIKVNDG